MSLAALAVGAVFIRDEAAVADVVDQLAEPPPVDQILQGFPASILFADQAAVVDDVARRVGQAHDARRIFMAAIGAIETNDLTDEFAADASRVAKNNDFLKGHESSCPRFASGFGNLGEDEATDNLKWRPC